ncbi:MAG TPA: metallophosphoesterase [Polyangiaceae bacterium]|nr:metallophosphoesterase [Polyangiaceae bacterium]
MNARSSRAPLFALALASAACLRVSEERARRDLEVGRAEAAFGTVEVEQGLSAVRRFEPGVLELWANAPVLHVRLTTPEGDPTTWSVRVRNLMADAEIFVDDGTGPIAADAPLETERRFELTVDSGGATEFEVRPPDADASEPFEFIALADVQDAMDRVGDIFALMNAEAAPRFAMFSGDITERGAADELLRFQDEMRVLRIPIYTTLGNHELGEAEVPYHSIFGRGSQSFVFKGVRFTFLDSASATVDPLVYGWLREWIEAAKTGTHLVFMHVPPREPIGLRNGAFSSRAEAAKLLKILGDGGVDTTFYGHVHSYYAFENAGIPAYISGGGGAIPERFDGIGRHYLVVSVDPESSATSVRVVRVD